MNLNEQVPEVDFSVDKDNLYREESITDLKTASLRRMIPIKADGSLDDSRPEMFMAHTQLMSPEGPVPLQASLKAGNLEDAMIEFHALREKGPE